MENWQRLRRIYVADKYSPYYINDQEMRIYITTRFDNLVSTHFSQIIKQPKLLMEYSIEEFKRELAVKKGSKLSGMEDMVINGYYRSLHKL